MKKNVKLINQIIEHELKELTSVKACYLIGSLVEGNYHPLSDIDILVIGSLSENVQKTLSDKLSRQFNRSVDFKIIDPQGELTFLSSDFFFVKNIFVPGNAICIKPGVLDFHLASSSEVPNNYLFSPLPLAKLLLQKYADFQGFYDSPATIEHGILSFRMLNSFLLKIQKSYDVMGIIFTSPLISFFKENITISVSAMPNIDLHVRFAINDWLQALKNHIQSKELFESNYLTTINSLLHHIKFVLRTDWITEDEALRFDTQVEDTIRRLAETVSEHFHHQGFMLFGYGSAVDASFLYSPSKEAISDFDFIMGISNEIFDQYEPSFEELKEKLKTIASPIRFSCYFLRNSSFIALLNEGSLYSFRHQFLGGQLQKINKQKHYNRFKYLHNSSLLLNMPNEQDDLARNILRNLKILRRFVEYQAYNEWPKYHQIEKLIEHSLTLDLPQELKSTIQNIIHYYSLEPTLKNAQQVFNEARAAQLFVIKNDFKKLFLRGSFKDLEQGNFDKLALAEIAEYGLEGNILQIIWMHVILEQESSVSPKAICDVLHQHYPRLPKYNVSSDKSKLGQLEEINGILWAYHGQLAQGYNSLSLKMTYAVKVELTIYFFENTQAFREAMSFKEFLELNDASIQKIYISDLDYFSTTEEFEFLMEFVEGKEVFISGRMSGKISTIKKIEKYSSISRFYLKYPGPAKWKKLDEKFQALSKKRDIHVTVECHNPVPELIQSSYILRLMNLDPG